MATSSSLSSIPLSPFETKSSSSSQSTSMQQEESSRRDASSPKSQSQVWQDLSDQLLLSLTTSSSSSSSSSFTAVEQNNIKECIQWWIRQRPITTQTQTYVWNLWEHLCQTNSSLSETTFDSLWLAVLDHWRLAVTEAGVMVRTPEQVWQAMQKGHSNSNSNTCGSSSIKAHGLLLDVLAQMNQPHEAEKLLNVVLQQYTDNDEQKMDPKSQLVLQNTVLTAWAKSTSPQAPERVVSLLQSMGDAVDVISYANALEALAKRITTEQPSQQSSRKNLIEQMEEIFAHAAQAKKMSPVIWLQRLQAWGSMDREKAKALLYTLRNEYLARANISDNDNDDDDDVVVPNQHLFTAVMSSFAKVGDFETVQQLWEDLRELDQRFGSHDQSFAPSPATLTTILHAFGRAKGVVDRAEKAQALLQVAVEQAPHVVERTAFNCVADAWAGSPNRHNVEAIQDLMKFMQQNGSNSNLQPDTYTYNALLKALSRSNRPNALDCSRQVLKDMWRLYSGGSETVKPNQISYSTILHAYSRLTTPDDVKRAELLFEELWKHYDSKNDPDFLPSESAYVSLITSWIRSKRKEAPSRAAYYFDHMRAKYTQTNNPRFQPSVRIYNTLIDSHKLHGDGPGAERILLRMIDDYRHGNTKAEPTTVTFNTVMTAFAKSGHPRAPEKVENILREMERLASSNGWSCSPNTWTYTIVLESWSSLRSIRGAERAETILRGLQKYYQSTKDEEVRPNNYCYNMCLHAWARSGCLSATDKTTELFDEMLKKYETGDEQLKPNHFTYTAILTAWSRSPRLDSGARALAILNEMDDRYRLDPESNVKPNPMHYSAVIHAFAKHGDVENAEAVLDRVLRNPKRIHANRACWNGVLKAYAKSKLVDAPERAIDLLRKMHSLSSHGFRESSPDTAVYTTILEILRFSGRESAFDEGLRLVHDMFNESNTHKNVTPDSGTFLALLRILNESTVPNKSEYIDRLIDVMKKENIRPSRAIHAVIEDVRRSAEIKT